MPDLVEHDKAEIQALALQVVINWLRNESHLDGYTHDHEIGWAQEIQEQVAASLVPKLRRLYARSKTVSEATRRANKEALAALRASRQLTKQASVLERATPLKADRAKDVAVVSRRFRRDPRVPKPSRTDAAWIDATDRSLRAVFGVVTSAGRIEVVALRRCDPARLDNEFEFFGDDDYQLRWRWLPDRGAFTMSGVTIAEKIKVRIDKRVAMHLETLASR